VISAIDPKDVRLSFEALDSGALAVLAKPTGPAAPDFAERAAEIMNTIKTMSGVRVVKRRPRLGGVPDPRPETRDPRPEPAKAPAPSARPSARRRIDLVAIGSSTGGPDALGKIVGALPPSAPVPILIVQHITVGFHQGLVDWLNNVTPLNVKLGVDGEPIKAGEVVIAPGEHHMTVDAGRRIKLIDDVAVRGHRPSATKLFQSVTKAYGAKALGVILTGMGDDGADGLVDLHNAGGWVIGQDEATCVVYGMPREAALRGAVNEVLPLGEIAGGIVSAWSHGRLAGAA
jgi:two-component system, chemotaxis family, protein-glutamate methylesterase/glutaminase